MMTHDPFQNYQAFSPYSGVPYTPFQPFVNPIAGQQGNPGIGGYAMYPQPFQGAGLQGAGVAAQQGYGQQGYGQPIQAPNPLTAGLQNQLLQNQLLQNQLLQNQLLQNQLLQNPLLQHPLAQGPWQNPLLATTLQNQLPNPMIANYGWPQQQQQPTYPLAPQSMIGAGGVGVPFGQIHPLAHAALRQATGYGYF
jgi:hypothetical protein